jgi:large subunit ribosomal protein L1
MLPSGTGKVVRVAVFARGENAEAAKAAGATIVGAEDLVQMIQDGDINFDKCIATPDMMVGVLSACICGSCSLFPLICCCAQPVVGKVARILGPRGLMPNPKVGTVTKDVAGAVQAVQGGQVEFRADKNGVIHAGVGKASFEDQALIDNIRTFMLAMGNAKPATVKGHYVLGVSLSSTMGKSVACDLSFVDPTSPKFMRFEVKE